MKKFYFLFIALCSFTVVNAQIITFSDANFKAKLLAAASTNSIAKNLSGAYFKIDANNNAQIEVAEALQVKELDVSYSSISSIAGIGNFTNLRVLKIGNNQIGNLNLEGLPNLYELECISNNMTTINVNGLSSLGKLNCGNNHLSSIDFTQTPNLGYFWCGGNDFTFFDLSSTPYIRYFDCSNNHVTSIVNMGNCSSMTLLSIPSNQISTIDLSGLTNLDNFNGSNNLFSSVDFSNNQRLLYFYLDNNPNLTSIFLKNGKDESALNFSGCPNLRYICADDSQVAAVQTKVTQYAYTCEVNTYCSFVPGGVYYTVNGASKFDSNTNGCDAGDITFPALRLNHTISGNLVGSYLANLSGGNYSVPVQAGTHTLTPVLENPSYFTISPTSLNVTFPGMSSPYMQNFCITPNGVHSDLEIVLLPLEAARPGFDVKYKIIYKNNGNQIQSGTVKLSFYDSVLDLVSSVPAVTSQTTNYLTWDFTNLIPFESREIVFTMNLNSPMETPPLNGGSGLSYSATLITPVTDDTPYNNFQALEQIVVNSFDPNDKTCLEGATIAPSEVGKYVHYLIRFENTGTYPAQNIVVKDMIDTAKFDINSLVPLKGSHSFVTNITSGNKVEFIFENINLPFDDANNDGYVAFKIKTLPTLVNGDTFSNTANIYFDYNFPIVTNTAVTTIQALSAQDFAFGNYFSLYPNPVSTDLNIAAKQTIEVSSISIYNQIGQLVLVVPNAQQTKSVDVSSLSAGNYFIKINSDKGTSNTKFVKK